MLQLNLISTILLITSSSFIVPEPARDHAVECTTNEGYVAALSEKYLDDVIRYSVDKDYVALQKLLDSGVAFPMKKGVKVYIVETHIFSGVIEFRIPGFTEVLWTVTEGLTCH